MLALLLPALLLIGFHVYLTFFMRDFLIEEFQRRAAVESRSVLRWDFYVNVDSFLL